ncbi:MAG: hypothetical protein Q8Q60_01790 [Candidatus Chromulinivorax sp.]|nr:hypothetical protein [Candidatus Chromulinivorax sp.]
MFSLLIVCNQLDASYNNTNQKRNKLHDDVAHLDHEAILALIYSYRDLTEILNDKNEQGDTPYDQAKKGAMNHYWPANTRKHFYAICKIFTSLNAPSSIELIPQPNDEKMKLEYIRAINSIVTPKPSKKDHLKK